MVAWLARPPFMWAPHHVWVPHHVFGFPTMYVDQWHQVSGTYPVSGIRYQVSAIRYQVSGAMPTLYALPLYALRALRLKKRLKGLGTVQMI